MTRPTGFASLLHERWWILLRHRGKAFCLFAGIMLATGAAAALWPRAYASQAKLLLRLGRENVTLDPTATLGQAPVVAVPPSLEHNINSVIEIIRSRALLEKVVDAFGPAVILGREPTVDDGPQAAGPKALARRD